MLKTIALQKKKFKYFRPLILTRHPTHSPLRAKERLLPVFPFRSVIRFGSLTEVEDSVTRGGNRIELNTVAAIKNSANKLLMKQCFTNNNVKTADWWNKICDNDHGDFFLRNDINTDWDVADKTICQDEPSSKPIPFPIVAKHIFGSRNNGNFKLDSQEELESWLVGKTLSNYIFEKFYNYSREYRLHVQEDGCFYTCRKMLRSDTAEDKRWYRNDSNSNWIVETNESFDKPVNWDTVIEESIKALKSVGLDFGAVDLRIQSKLDKDGNERTDPDFIVVEINSAPSFGTITLDKYLVEIPKILNRKYASI